MAPAIRGYLTKHKDPELEAMLRETLAKQPSSRRSAAGAAVPEDQASLQSQEEIRAQNSEEAAAYSALNGKRLAEADHRFQAILTRDPNNARALAGMGYVRMNQSNFGGAISFLEQAKQNGAKDAGLENALAASRFWYTMGDASRALNENDLATAESQYRAALAMRANSPEALEGLGGTLLKAQQPEAAISVFERYAQVKSAAPAAWRGLFTAQYQAGKPQQALATEARMPAAVKSALRRDPEFLRTLASAYSAVGRDADAQRVLRSALDLPFPANGQGLKAETELQYASLLLQANRMDQAAGLYRQALSEDPSNVGAWQGLVRVQHSMKQDADAVRTLESMPQATYDAALRDPGFLSTIASIYQQQNQLEVAQGFLEKAVAAQTTAGQQPSVSLQLQLASVYLARKNPQAAYPIFQHVLMENPNRTDAWKGLLSAMHQTGQDRAAVAEIQQIPPPVRSELEHDVDYLQTMGSVYGSLGDSRQAMVFLNQVQQHYRTQGVAAPADVEIQNAYLLYNAENDAGLYAQLMRLGSKANLTDDQRRQVQTIWAQWSVRRSNQAEAAGNPRRALLILNAASKAFPDNPGVSRALATGYLRANMPKQALAIYKTQDLSSASAGDYQGAINTALAAGDNKLAEQWLRYALDLYPRDSQILSLAARFERARGDNSRAADYLKASLAAMPPSDPGADLARALSQLPEKGPVAKLPKAQNEDLASLLAPGSDVSGASSAPPPPPYLPSYSNAYGQAPVVVPSGMAAGGDNPSSYPAQAPREYGSGAVTPAQSAPRKGRLKDYVPQASMGSGPLPSPVEGSDYSAPLSQSAKLQPPVYEQAGQSSKGNDVEADIQEGYQRPASYEPPMTDPSASYTSSPDYAEAHPQAAPPARPSAVATAVASAQQSGSVLRYNSPDGPEVTPQLGNASYGAPPVQEAAQPAGQQTYGPYVPYNPNAGRLHGTPVGDTGAEVMQQPEASAEAYSAVDDGHAAAQAYQRQQIQRLTKEAQRSAPQFGEYQAGEYQGSAAQVNSAAANPDVKRNATHSAPNARYAGSMVAQESGRESVRLRDTTGAVDPYELYREQQGQATTLPGLRAQPSQAELSQVVNPQQQTDVFPTVRYVPNAPSQATVTHPDVAAARASAARAEQSRPTRSMMGQSRPPAGRYQNAQTALYSTPDIPGSQEMEPQPGTLPGRGTDTNLPITSEAQYTSQPQPAAGQFAGQLGQQYQQPIATGRGTRRSRSGANSSASAQQGADLAYPPPPSQTYSQAPSTAPYPLGAGPTDADLMQRNLPPLRGPYNPSAAHDTTPLTPREEAERDLAMMETSYSGWLGGTGIARYRSGTPGFDRLTDFEAPFEASVVLGKTLRATVIPRAVFLNSGVADGSSGQRIGTAPVGFIASQQLASGVGGELQLTTANFGVAAGYTPYDFLVSNITARFRWKPFGGPITLFGERQPVVETQLSYAGLRDPGTATNVFGGNIWGGVISTGGGVRADVGNERAGFFISADGAQLTGHHVLDNTKFEGLMGTYFRVYTVPGYGNLQVGANFFGQHYQYNELGYTYGQGGYFSPKAYFLAAVPITWNGYYKTQWHYVVSASLGVQAFQQDKAPFFPLDVPLQTASGNPFTPITTDAGANYSIDSEGSYRIADHWYAGAFVSGNNTNNYNTVSGGFFVRYLFRSLQGTEDYPTGLFPHDGLRTLRVP